MQVNCIIVFVAKFYECETSKEEVLHLGCYFKGMFSTNALWHNYSKLKSYIGFVVAWHIVVVR